nr:MAG TPA: hypothetical protein [Caudoviricetes sp.]
MTLFDMLSHLPMMRVSTKYDKIKESSFKEKIQCPLSTKQKKI